MTHQFAADPDVTFIAPHETASGRVEPEIRVYSHSTLLYWWPAWAFGLVVGIISASQQKLLSTEQNEQATSRIGLAYISLLLLLIIFTNVRLRGLKSVVVLLAVGFITVLLAWFGWWDEIAKLLPYLSVHMDAGFYLVFSTALLIVWLLMFFVFDRMNYWRVRPGQLTIEHRIGGGAESFDTNALRFQKLSSDLFRVVLGLGTGDLEATGGPNGPTLRMSNVPCSCYRKIDRSKARYCSIALLRRHEGQNFRQHFGVRVRVPIGDATRIAGLAERLAFTDGE